MGYIFDFKDAGNYDVWLDQDKNRYCLNLEIKLLLDLLSPVKGQRILDIGCGTGTSLEPLLNKGLNLTGIDPSLYMLDIASKNLKLKWTFIEVLLKTCPLKTTSLTLPFFLQALNLQTGLAKPLKRHAE